MADGAGRSEAFAPWLIKAGVPLAVAALAGLVYAKRNTNSAPKESSLSSPSVDHTIESTACVAEEKGNDNLVEDARNEVLLGLVDQIKELQEKEEELEAQFERYQSMKECEGVLLELTTMLHLEMARGANLEKEVLSIEAEARRVQELEIYGLNLFQNIKMLEQENRRLKNKVKKFSRERKEGIRVIGAQKLRIQENEATIMRSRDQVKNGVDVVKNMAKEISKLQDMVNDLKRDKMQLSEKLELAKASLTLKHEGEIITTEEYKHIIDEVVKLQKEVTTEVTELAYLRWKNACLKHQLMQRNEVAGPERSDYDLGHLGGENRLLEVELHHELDRMAMERENSSMEVKSDKRKTPIKKLKKWFEGRHHSDRSIIANKGDVKSFGRHFSSDWVEEHVHGRKSFSSA